VARSRENGIEHSGSVKFWKILGQPLKKDLAA
jgi:hypothetical protein